MNFTQQDSINHFLLQSIRELENIELHYKKITTKSWSNEHDHLLSLWEKSGHLELFLKKLNTNKDAVIATQNCLRILVDDLIKTYDHFNINNKRTLPDSFRNLKDFSTNQNYHKIQDGDFSLNVQANQNEVKKITRIHTALEEIKSFSPESYERFKCFTHTIIPITDRKIVSYSFQSLPGVSYINMVNRDRIDLLDDLLHENGHHHLNAILRFHPLFDESYNEAVFYSPWRQQLRPLRGIYHGYFTFFWALVLFHDLSQNIGDVKKIMKLSKSEVEKIHLRFHEEYRLLHQAYDTLVLARKDKLIDNYGWRIVQQLQKKLIQMGQNLL